MKKYSKPFIDAEYVITNEVILVSASDEVLDYNKGADEEWD